jgi:hypothetical protein
MPQTQTQDYDYANQQLDGCSDEPPPIPAPDGLRPYHPAPRWPRQVNVSAYSPNQRNTCPYANTLILENTFTGKYLAVGTTCKRWQCPPCASDKIHDLAYWTRLAAPNRLLTATVNPKHYDNPELAWISTAPKLPELFRSLRTRFGSIEYLRVVEEHKSGYPHYHCMVRSDYIPQPVVKRIWHDLTGADIVDIRKVEGFFNSIAYLTKYLTKLRRVDWTDRHVTYSRNFFPAGMTPGKLTSEWRVMYRANIHPYAYLRREYEDLTFNQTGPLAFELPGQPHVWVPAHPIDAPIKPKTQQTLGQF